MGFTPENLPPLWKKEGSLTLGAVRGGGEKTFSASHNPDLGAACVNNKNENNHNYNTDKNTLNNCHAGVRGLR